MSTTLPPAAITGVGAITPIGRDLLQIAGALARPSVAPERVGDGLCRRVAEELLADPATSRQMRRSGRYPRMAAIAAADAMAEASRIRTVAPERTGLIVATGLGPHVRTFRFLDGILDCGDNAALPTDFSHSVHGAAASYIAEMLGIRGPVCTVTDFEVAFEQAVQLAQCWLAAGDCDRVLVGSVEELGEVLLHVVPRLVPNTVAGEGAAFFVLEASESGMLIDAADGLRFGGRDVRDEWPHFGQMATGRAMRLLAEALSTRAR